MSQVAGLPGALNIPPALKQAEERAILQGRIKELNLPTLNEFRAFLGLKVVKKALI